MASTESIRQIAHSRAPLSTWLGVVLLFALFGVIVLAIIGPMPRGSDYEETRAKKRMEILKTVRDDAEKALNTYAWVDKAKGVVRIPISRAMDLMMAELAQKKPAPVGPIFTPRPQASPAGAAGIPSASPAASGSPKSGAAQLAASPSAPASAAAASPPAQTAASTPQAATSPAPAAQPAQSTSASPSPASTP